MRVMRCERGDGDGDRLAAFDGETGVKEPKFTRWVVVCDI